MVEILEDLREEEVIQEAPVEIQDLKVEVMGEEIITEDQIQDLIVGVHIQEGLQGIVEGVQVMVEIQDQTREVHLEEERADQEILVVHEDTRSPRGMTRSPSIRY